MSFADTEIMLSENSLALRLYRTCRRICYGRMHAPPQPPVPTDLCTLVQMYAKAVMLLLSVTILALFLLVAAGAVGFLLWMAFVASYESQLKVIGGNQLYALFATLGWAVLITVAICAALVAMAGIAWCFELLIQGVSRFMSFLQAKGWLPEERARPAKHVKPKPVTAKVKKETSFFHLAGQWLYDQAHGICRPIKVVPKG